MPGLVLHVAGDEDLVFLIGAHHERGQLGLDVALAVVEALGHPQEDRPLLVGHLLPPVDGVLGEVQVVDIPALPQVALVQRQRRRDGPQAVVDVLDDVIDVHLLQLMQLGALDDVGGVLG